MIKTGLDLLHKFSSRTSKNVSLLWKTAVKCVSTGISLTSHNRFFLTQGIQIKCSQNLLYKINEKTYVLLMANFLKTTYVFR